MESHLTSTETPVLPEFLSGGGELGEYIRKFDWSTTPLGPVHTWPQNLRTCVRIMLTSRQPIWIGWGKELIKLYNDPYKAIVGGKHPSALGKPASEVWKDIWHDIDPLLRKVMEHDQGTYVESQLLIMERNGYPEETYYTFSYTPIPGDDGKTAGMFCANTDDTAKIISERQLKTLTLLGKRLSDCETNQDVIENTITTLGENPQDFPFALFRKIENGKAVLVSHTDLAGSRALVDDEVALQADGEIPTTIRRALETGQPALMEGLTSKIGQLPTGAWQIPPDNVLVIPVHSTATREPIGVLVVGLNPYRLLDEKYQAFFQLITDQLTTAFGDVRTLEEERKRAAALAEIDRAKTIFFSNISHEFRTPLSLLVGPIEDALQEPEAIEENKARLDVALRNARRMQKLVNTLLDFSRIEAGRMEGRFSRVNICKFTEDLVSTFRSAVEKAGMQLVFNCGRIKEDVYVDVDMWEKIILNLVSNAFKYSKKGSIIVSVAQAGKSIQVSVKDTGIGIPSDQIEKIFNRFHRVEHSEGRSQEGTGIGLAMVMELVKIHNGNIEVSSELGKGSTFTVNIPAGKDHLPPEKINESAHTGSSGTHSVVFAEEAMKWLPLQERKAAKNEVPNSPIGNLTGDQIHKVLIADDNADMREYLQRLLAEHFEVITAKDGNDAYEKMITDRPELVLSDIMMPLLDGFGLLEKIRQHPELKHTPVIFLSARAGEEAKVEGLDAGADDYLVKPFSAKELLVRVTNHIRINKVRRETEQQFYQLFLQAPATINVFKGPQHHFEFFHPKNKEVFGNKDFTGMTVREALPELEQQDVLSILDEVYQTGQTVTKNEMPVQLRDESGVLRERFFNVAYKPWHNLRGEVQGVLNFSIDVTETVQARKRIELSENLFRSVLEQAPDPILILKGPDMVLEVANQPLFNVWQVDSSAIGKKFLDILPEAKEQGFLDLLQDVYFNDKIIKGTETPATFHRQDGTKETVYFNFIYQPYREMDGQISGVLVIANDVTQQVKAKQQLVESDERFRLVTKATQDAVWDWELQTNSLWWNEGFKTLFGFEDYEIDPTVASWYNGIHPDDQDRVVNGIHEIIDKGDSFWIDEYRFRTSQGSYKSVLDRGYVIRDASGKATRMLGSMQDITERKRIESILKGQKEAFEQAVHAEPLPAVLETLVRAAETNASFPLSASLLLLDEEGQRLLHGAAPSLPEAYNAAIHGISIGEQVGSCGTAAFLQKEVVVADIANDPRWHNFKDLALTHGLRACWSTPIFSSRGKVLGTFAFYYPEIHTPSEEDKDVVNLLSRSAGIVIEWYQDVLEKQKAEKALMESEKRFRMLADQTPMIIYIVEPNEQATMSYFNKTWLDYTGQNYDEALERAWNGFIHPDDLHLVFEKYTEGFRNKEAYTIPEVRLKRHDGEYRWHTFKGSPRFLPNGGFIGHVGVGFDIHERKLAEEALKQSEEQFRTLADSIQNLTWMARSDGWVYWYNNRWFEYTGAPASEMEGWGWRSCYHPEEQDAVMALTTEGLRSEEPFEFTFQMRRHDGEYRWFLTRVHPLNDSNGNVVRWVGTSTDIDDQKTFQEKLEMLVTERTQELQRSNQDLQQFAHVASHDLKEPVRKIKTFTLRLEDEFAEMLPEKGKTFINKVQNATDRMIAMIDGVLNYSKADAEKQPISDVDLNEVIDHVEADLEIPINQKNAQIKRGRLPAVPGASLLIYQLFYNLVNNSLKFAKEDTHPVITISSKEVEDVSGRYAAITIEDNGIGFQQEYAEKIFNTFTRLHSKDRFEGTGLGLALCKKIVERHRGQISAKGEREQGATFTILLPMKQENARI